MADIDDNAPRSPLEVDRNLRPIGANELDQVPLTEHFDCRVNVVGSHKKRDIGAVAENDLSRGLPTRRGSGFGAEPGGPFIRISHGPGAPACYFYNRLDHGAMRWVSYHYEAEPEVTHRDPALEEILGGFADIPPE